MKLPKTKVSIQPESKKTLKQMEEKVKSIEREEMFEISITHHSLYFFAKNKDDKN